MQLQQFNVTILQGASLSNLIRLAPFTLVGIIMPAGWDAASITFVSSEDGVASNNVYDSLSNEYTVQAAAGIKILIPAGDLSSLSQFQLRSGGNASPVNQTATRLIGLMGALL